MTFKKVSVLVPTRGRVERIHTLLESYERTWTGRAELVFRVDDDDPETQSLLMRHNLYRRWRMICGSRFEGYKSTPQFFNEAYEASTGDVLMAGNDDMVFKTPGWDALILEAANQYPDGLFDFGVSTHNEGNFPFATVSKWACDTVGFFFDPRLFWGDLFWRDVMMYFGRAIPLPYVQIDHDWAGFKPDGVFLAGENTRRADHTHFHGAAVEEAIKELEMMRQGVGA